MPPKDSDIKALHARIKDLEDRMNNKLEKKKDRDVVDVEIAELKKPHPCIQRVSIATMTQSIEGIEGGIREIKSSLNKWKTIKYGGVVAIVIALVSGAAYMVRASTKTDTVEQSVQNIETDVSQLKISNERMEGRLVDMKSDSKAGSEEDMKEIRRMFREELESARLPKSRRPKK